MRSNWFDGLAIGTSALCLVHCLALPVAAAALPSLTALAGAPDWLHAVLLTFALPTSLAALLLGYLRHGAVLPMLSGAIGLGLMGAGLAFHEIRLAETGLTVAGTTLLAAAHLGNWRLRRRTS